MTPLVFLLLAPPSITATVVAGRGEILSVRVAGSATPLLGDNAAGTFRPRFPFSPGVTYSAATANTQYTFTFAAPAVLPVTVTALEPTADAVPENCLRLYVHFARPMARGGVYEHFILTNTTDNKRVDLPFLELDEELWNPDQTRLTLLFDPGRIKRDVKPREDLGPALEAGKAFTLTAGAGLAAADGGKLVRFTKTFRVTAPDNTAVEPAKWVLKPSPNVLDVAFEKPLDAGLVRRCLSVVDAAGKSVAGAAELKKHASGWEFTPAAPFAAGKYTLNINHALEDPCGTRLGEPFELDVFKPITKDLPAKVTARGFDVR